MRASSVFLLVLTNTILKSWFCRQEMLCALDEGKKIQLIVEEDSRHDPWDAEGWQVKAVKDGVPCLLYTSPSPRDS